MAIEFNCPHCDFAYRGRQALKDEFAGKTAKCRNPNCRQVITIPQAGTATLKPGDTPPPSPPIDVEAAALSVLADAPAEQVAPQTVPMTCDFCGHQWTEPIAKAGKNTLCPNPECRQRMKVPVPKDHIAQDWRTGGHRGPSLAKENFEKPTDVQDAGDAKIASRESFRQAGVELEEIEPRSPKQKALIALAVVLPPLLIGCGIWLWISSRTARKHDNLMAEAIREWDEKLDDSAKPPAAEVPLYAAVLRLAAGEYAVRKNEKAKFKEGFEEFERARTLLKDAPQKDSPGKPVAAWERNALLAELAVSHLTLGGTDDQAKAELRFRWVPDTTVGKAPRVQERGTSTVHRELTRTLELLRGAEFDYRAAVARRLTRELARRGQPGLAVENLHTMLFEAAEQPEARAVVALEIYRLDKDSEHPRAVAEWLKQVVRSPNLNPYPASATTLWKVLGTDKVPLIDEPSANGQVGDQSGSAYTGVYLLQGRPDDAVKLAQRIGKAEPRLRALALCAEWLDDPTPALDAALPTVGELAKKKDAGLPQAATLRLAQRAAEVGKADEAKALAEGLADDGLRAWARATPPAKGSIDEAAVETPDDVRKYRVGHAWARLALARQNAKAGGWDPKKLSGWPAVVKPFGLAGIALGQEDRDGPPP